MKDVLIYYSNRKYIFCTILYVIIASTSLYLFVINEGSLFLVAFIVFMFLTFYEIRTFRKNKGKVKFVISEKGIFTEFNDFKSWDNIKDAQIVFKSGVMAKGFRLHLILTLRNNKKMNIPLYDAAIGYFKLKKLLNIYRKAYNDNKGILNNK